MPMRPGLNRPPGEPETAAVAAATTRGDLLAGGRHERAGQAELDRVRGGHPTGRFGSPAPVSAALAAATAAWSSPT